MGFSHHLERNRHFLFSLSLIPPATLFAIEARAFAFVRSVDSTVSRMALYFAGVADCFTALYLIVTRRHSELVSGHNDRDSNP